MVVAVTALVSSFAGPAIADQAAELAKRSKLIPGSKIKPRSIAGNRLKANTVTGKEINESKLGKVPSAAKADSATTATSATHATTATNATNAARATSAATADNATNATSAVNAANAADAETLDGFDSSDFNTSLWAVVEATGTTATVIRGNGAIGAGRTSNGLFYVSFDRDVTGCGYVASVGSTTDGSAPLYSATVEQRPNNPTDIWVQTFNSTGLQTPGTGNGFHIAVLC
jgi:cytoskeletal protein RodZ